MNAWEWRDSFVLAVGASPNSKQALDIAREFAQVKAALRRSSDSHSPWHNKWAFVAEEYTTGLDLEDRVSDLRPIVLHISAHAGKDAVVFSEANSGDGVRLDNDNLVKLVTAYRSSHMPYPGVIVLNGCCTDTLANALAEISTPAAPQGPFVVGTAVDLPDDKAIAFTEAFYVQLANGQSLWTSFQIATRNAVGPPPVYNPKIDDVVDRDVYRLHGGQDRAEEYFIPPKNYRSIPICPSYGADRRSYEKLLVKAKRPIKFATFQYSIDGGGATFAAGIEYALQDLPKAGSDEISGFGDEADQLLRQSPRVGLAVKDKDGDPLRPRYFLNILKAITADDLCGPAIFASNAAGVYYESNGEWKSYTKVQGWETTDLDPVRWRDYRPFD